MKICGRGSGQRLSIKKGIERGADRKKKAPILLSLELIKSAVPYSNRTLTGHFHDIKFYGASPRYNEAAWGSGVPTGHPLEYCLPPQGFITPFVVPGLWSQDLNRSIYGVLNWGAPVGDHDQETGRLLSILMAQSF